MIATKLKITRLRNLTIWIFSGGAPTEYNGGRTEDTIVEWIKKKTGPPSIELSAEALTAKKNTVKKAVVYIGAVDTPLYAAHVAAGKDGATAALFEFLHSTDESVAATFGLSGPGLVVVRNFDEQLSTYTGDATKEGIVAFAASKQNAILINFDEDSIEPIFGKKQAALILFSN